MGLDIGTGCPREMAESLSVEVPKKRLDVALDMVVSSQRLGSMTPEGFSNLDSVTL